MAKRRRVHKRRGDPLGDLQDWQEHQYDPGYYRNLGRLGWLSGRRRRPAVVIVVVLGAMFAVPALLALLSGAGASVRLAQIVVAALLIIGALVAVSLALRMGRARARSRSPAKRRRH